IRKPSDGTRNVRSRTSDPKRLLIAAVQVDRQQAVFPGIGKIGTRIGDAVPIGSKRYVAVNSAYNSLSSTSQHRCARKIKIGIRRVHCLPKVEIVSVRRK